MKTSATALGVVLMLAASLVFIISVLGSVKSGSVANESPTAYTTTVSPAPAPQAGDDAQEIVLERAQRLYNSLDRMEQQARATQDSILEARQQVPIPTSSAE